MKSQIKKLISIFACVCLLLTAIIIPASATPTEVVFEFGANGSAAHVDGNDMGASKSYTVDGYTLALTNASKCFTGATDQTGKSALKLGTSKVIGSFNFTAPDDVTSVIIKVAQYKTNTTKINVNGAAYTITTASNSGAYTDITVDTTTTKAVAFATVSGGVRCMIDSITFVIADTTGGDEGGEEACTHVGPTSFEPNGNKTHKVICGSCGEPINAAAECVDEDVNGECDNCGGDVAIPVQDPAADSELSIVDAAALGASKAHDTYTAGKYYIEGKIAAFQSNANATKYGNFYLEDETGNQILIYGLYSADGTVRYDAMETKPVAGDTVKLYGMLGQYSGTAQMKSAWLVEHTPATTPDEGGDEGGEVTPPAGGDEGGEVTPPAGGEGGNDPVADNAEISFEDVANRTSYTTEQQVWVQNGVTVTGDKDDSTTDVRDSSNPARFYKSSKVTIAYPQMTGIVIKAQKAGSDDYTTAWSDSFDAILATATVDGTTVIIALNEAADTFEFDLTAQARAYTITVYTGEFNAEDFIDNTPAFDPAGKTAAEIVDAAYALESGAAFESNATLTGEIVNIDTPYSSQYENITVTIKVDGADANKTIMCYRLMGDGADTLAVGDKITVTGIIKNYNGTIEFDQGCTLDALVKGEGEVPTAPEDPKEIVDEAFALEIGKTLPYAATLTGKITNIEKINEEYGDVCLTIAVEGSDGEKELYCYNLKPTEGIDLATLAVGDTITVTGNLKNYNGTIEFISCSFVMADTEGDGTGTGGTGSGEGEGTGTGTGEGTGSSTNTGSDATTGTDTGATTDTTSPDTGDNVGAIVAMAAVAAAVLVVSKKRA